MLAGRTWSSCHGSSPKLGVPWTSECRAGTLSRECRHACGHFSGCSLASEFDGEMRARLPPVRGWKDRRPLNWHCLSPEQAGPNIQLPSIGCFLRRVCQKENAVSSVQAVQPGTRTAEIRRSACKPRSSCGLFCKNSYISAEVRICFQQDMVAFSRAPGRVPFARNRV